MRVKAMHYSKFLKIRWVHDQVQKQVLKAISQKNVAKENWKQINSQSLKTFS